MSRYIEVEEAVGKPGLRLVLSEGVPGPFGEAAKAILHVKGIPYLPVRQHPGMENPALRRWTGHENAPIAVLDDERPRVHWTEILFLAERLAPEPRLVPEDPEQRALLFGLAHEIVGENGFGWCRRLEMFERSLGRAPGGASSLPPGMQRMIRSYGSSPETTAAAPERAAQVLRMLAARLHAQRERGSPYFLGQTLTALDLFWAAFAALVEPLPPDLCPMPEQTRAMYEGLDPKTRSAADPILLEHRDRIYREWLELPMWF